jgi:hypothetical protein
MELQLAELQRIDFTQFSYEEALKRLVRVLVRTPEGIARPEQQPATPVKKEPDRILTDNKTTRTTNAADSNQSQKSGEQDKARRKVSSRREASDNRLPGHWRTTETLSSSGFSMATDTHCLLEASGRFQWWSSSGSSLGQSSLGQTRSEPECGNWSSLGNTLRLNFDDGRNLTFEYVLEGTSLFFPREKRRRLWERIN